MRTPSQNRTTGESNTNQRYKKLSFDYQFSILNTEFSKGAFTMKTISVKTGIDRANICRFIARKRANNSVFLVKKGICPITKSERVGFYTTSYDVYLQLKYYSDDK